MDVFVLDQICQLCLSFHQLGSSLAGIPRNQNKAVSKSNLPRCSWVLAVLASRKNLLHCLSVLFQILIAYPIKSTLCISQNHSDELTTTYLSFHFPSVLSLWASHDSAFFPRMYGHSHNWLIVLMVTSVSPPPLPSSLSYTRSVPFYSTLPLPIHCSHMSTSFHPYPFSPVRFVAPGS